MNLNLPRVLMLVLASDTDPMYIQFQDVWRKIMNSHPNIDCYFYKGNPSQEEEYIMIDKNTLSIRIDDGYPMIYEKMRLAFSYFEKDLHTYDFLCRPNLSSFMVFENYMKTLSSIQSQKDTKTKFCWACVVKYRELLYPSGAAFTISTDIVQYIIHNPLQRYIEDDVTVGVYLKEMGVMITPGKKIDILSEETECLIDVIDTNVTEIYHYRLKSNCGDRKKDVEYFKRLIEKYYIKN